MKLNWNYIWGILAAISFGSLTTIAKLAMLNTSPETILITRFFFTSFIIGIIALITGNLRKLNVRRNYIPILILGILFSLETIFFWVALEDMDILPFLALFWTYPLFIYSFDCIQNRKISLNGLALLVIGCIGVLLATGTI